ncbi:class I SAM-dependent methyltransferase [Sphingomonas sp. PAMC 26605]|uniref:class I SAM-dependent methyltransferase n=1 Tax=Sphingomonas sp. PAMC 26605 TaxID=1112214 RepID=UPI001E503ED8|nr:methyltransferase [Sphingomonas sp. PAMC 26605]
MATAPDPALQMAVAADSRPANDRARDRYRHPLQSLQFWGVRPGQVVVDLQPGGGYWTEILAPYLAKTGGSYVAGVADLDNPKLSAGAKADRARFEAKHADTAVYGRIRYAAFGPVAGPLAPPNSVDVILTAREIHNWIPAGFVDKAMKDCFAALKPGGVFAVEEHRAGPKTAALEASGQFTGYVSTKAVVDAAKKAGFVLDASSEINANPKDTKDYPFGVWTLPPSRDSAGSGHAALTTAQRARYDAIGESDRMTLRFRKPA